VAERETHIQTMLVDLDAAATAIAAAEASMEGKVAELVVAKAAKSESETALREEIAALETTLTAQVCLSVSTIFQQMFQLSNLSLYVLSGARACSCSSST
jgi:hypothetical protein